ncbi:MAG TPA: MoaD/ThiS family protein [Bacteroidetes bacterium]|nr:MoaD/ThiS family protein [Bacteroidota bacterium]
MHVYFWGVTAEATGTEMLEIRFSGPLTELKENLLQSYPSLSEWKHVITVNGSVASGDQKVEDNDRVDVVPPFAGG